MLNETADFKNIDDLFSSLNSRLDRLQTISGDIFSDESITISYSISNIERSITDFPTHKALNRVETAILEVDRLLKKGILIFEKVAFVTQTMNFHPFEPTTIKPGEKEKVYSKIVKELEYYKSHLAIIKERLKSKNEIRVDDNSITKYEIVIDDNFNLSELKKGGKVKLTVAQLAILFYYLKMENIILTAHTQTSLSKILSLLTGYSEDNLRSGGFASISKWANKEDININLSIQNLNIVKQSLEDIIHLIEKQIKTLENL